MVGYCGGCNAKTVLYAVTFEHFGRFVDYAWIPYERFAAFCVESNALYHSRHLDAPMVHLERVLRGSRFNTNKVVFEYYVY